MKTILFCPPDEFGNTLQERYAEQAIGEAFEGKVISLALIKGESDEEIFDQLCDCDLVVVMTIGDEPSVSERTYDVVKAALQINKPVYQVKHGGKK
jgi:CMP-2-keto-3-deoxyoctulosonic acid synthetase